LVAALVAQQFPEWSGQAVVPVEPGGWDNRTFRLGNELLVRLPSREAYVAQVEKEQRWLPLLAQKLPLPIPSPVALGAPGLGYPWPWSIYRWLDGESVRASDLATAKSLAHDLTAFLRALHELDPAEGPPPGEHNFFRGGPLSTYDGQTRDALRALGGRVDTDACARVWDAALAATWAGPVRWLHGDVAASNLLLRDHRLAAVIDFGSMAVGDMACDLTIAWTLFTGASRSAFRETMSCDGATWARARGWTLWKALILIAWDAGPASAVSDANRVLQEVLGD
ncbi:MAG TPA: aminoglycoside phosphotransferase family protein, partial [Polyangiaceae bacterium]|nr:aminoglycoside phosphotransferase family protein [Polyangiaceae bacterium]